LGVVSAQTRSTLLCAALFCAVLLFAFRAAAAPRTLNLEQAVEAVRNNPVARAAVAAQRAAEAQAAEARGARWLHVQLTSFIAPSPEIRCEDAACTRTSPSEVRLAVHGVFGGVKLDVVQPVYTFGKLDAAARAGESAAQMMGALADGVVGDMAVEATRAYFGVELARELARMLEDGERQITKGKETIVERLAKGDADVTVQDRLRVESLLTEVSLRRSEAREKEFTALEGLRALCGKRDVDVAEAALLPIELELAKPDSYWQKARTGSPNLQAAEHGVAALTERTELERARWWPDLAVVGGVMVSGAQGVDDSPSAFANDPFNAQTAQIAAVMRWTVEPAMQGARVTRAEEEQRRGQALLEAARASVEFSVRDAHNRAVEANTRLELARQGEKSARGWVTSVLQADAVGTASARDLADAYLAYFTLHSRLLQSIYDWNLAVSALERAIGGLPGAAP
jgi:outer membrane protein TolC